MAELNRITVISESGIRYDLTPYGRSYTENSELITREDRAASGKLRRDIIAEKRTFSLNYEIIDTKGLEEYEKLFDQFKDEVLTIEIVRKDQNGVDKIAQYKVLMRPFSRQRASKGLWQGVTVEFVEV
jgi:hypothetical protein